MGESVESFISVDCFLVDTGLFTGEDSSYYLKVLVVAFLPLLIGCLYLAIIGTVKVLKKSSKEMFINWIVIGIIVILYTLHPTVNRFMLSLYNCIELN